MEDDEHYVDDPNNPQYQHHGGEYAYQGGNSGGDFESEGFQGEHEGYEASGKSFTFQSIVGKSSVLTLMFHTSSSCL